MTGKPHLKPIIYSTLSGLLLVAGWPTSPLVSLLFVGWVPLLVLHELSLTRLQKWAHTYWTLLIWNIGTTWWVCNASLWGGVAAIVLNALLMSVPWLIYHQIKLKFNPFLGFLSLVVCWLGFEKIHLTWELTWPWLTLGNGMAMYPKFVQWYSFTGHLGGSLWIWLVNLLLFMVLTVEARKWLSGAGLLLTVFMPLLWSMNHYNNAAVDAPTQINVAIVQPNIDPYNEKFQGGNDAEQLAKFIKLSEQVVGSETALLLFPETAIPTGVWKKSIGADENVNTLKEFLAQHEQLNLLTGCSLIDESDSCTSSSAEPLGNSGKFYEVYNAALFLKNEQSPQYYIKSKLVPGVERMPYPGFFKFLKPLLINLGGSSQNLGTQPERTNFISDTFQIAPVICYESVFGSYVAEYVRKGANLICIITNDGWWGDTEGHRQHLHYASLRAIETHRTIARCANTGISCFITERGDIQQATNWWEASSLQRMVNLQHDETFFVRYGDLFEWEFVFGALIFVIAILLKRLLP